MSCSQCVGIQQEFSDGMARRELRRYTRKGASRTTRALLDAITAHGVRGRTFLDIGGGVGVIQHELMAEGAGAGVNVDASPAYTETARAEAMRRGYAERMTYVTGDFTEMADRVDSADIVTLDRVLCCYDDMPTLVDSSASRARRMYGFVYPRDRWWVRLGVALINVVQRLRRRPFRVFVHAPAQVDARVRSHGFRRDFRNTFFFWQVLLYIKDTRVMKDAPTAAD